MMRPFISSFGKDTTETVFSETESAAQRWIANDKRFFALRSASSLARCSDSFTINVNSWFSSSSVDFMMISLASSRDKAATRSSSCCCPSISFSTSCSRSSINCCFALSFRSRSSRECSRFSMVSSLRSNTCSLWSKRFSCDLISSLLSFNSLSICPRYFWFSSLASNNASFFRVSASFLAFFKIPCAEFSAPANSSA